MYVVQSLQKKLFVLWLLLLPISWVVASHISIVAPDKMLAPLLIVLGVASVFRAPPERTARVVVFGALIVLLLLVKQLSFMGSGSIYWVLIWDDMVKFGYFMVPVLCIRDLSQFHKTSWVVTLIAIAGCISAFLVSIGLLTLPVERFEESRLGVESLRKAIGLFPSYGDLAQYLAFAVLWVIVSPGRQRSSDKKIKVMRYLVAVSVVVGLLGTQSRNVLLSLLVALAVLWMYTRLERAGVRVKTGLILGLTGVFIVFMGVIAVFASDIVNALSGLGGQYAQNTAMARLDQYALAWKIISASPLLGADLTTYQQLGTFIEGIHNMWLRLTAHGGLLSVLVMAVLLVRVFYGVRDASRVPEKATYAKVATGYLAALVVAVEFYVGMGEMFWVLLGIVASLSCIPPFHSSPAAAVEISSDNGRKEFGDSRILVPRKRAL